jgi:hypothetical protein
VFGVLVPEKRPIFGKSAMWHHASSTLQTLSHSPRYVALYSTYSEWNETKTDLEAKVGSMWDVKIVVLRISLTHLS